MRIGMIGLDTSHSEIFTSLLNDRSATHHVPGGLITHAMPIYSEDLPISFERYPKYRDIVERRYDVIIVTEVDVLMDNVDAVIIGTVDGRNHLHWFKKVVSYKKPVFIDKPIAMSDREVD
ncbi:Gfo/Idh/MocA family oxidoreductase [Lederbergia citrisecunda]|uniref:Gfo/Idh/MocA family oxidoreductase n=2 Tax=Bacillales TaxID=1385 RepID=UPI003D2D5338